MKLSDGCDAKIVEAALFDCASLMSGDIFVVWVIIIVEVVLGIVRWVRVRWPDGNVDLPRARIIIFIWRGRGGKVKALSGGIRITGDGDGRSTSCGAKWRLRR